MAEIVRLSINLATDTAAALKARAAQKGVNLTEAIRRSIAVWDLLEGYRTEGYQVALVRDGRISEVIIND